MLNIDEEIHYNDDLTKLNFKFNLNDRFIYVTNNKEEYFSCNTPFLKILKPIHITLNKKKTIAKKYLILETNDELDFNNQIGEFMYIINKVHEICQEKIRENSIQWFNTEFDDIGLDIKVRRPIDSQKDNEFIKISIPKEKSLEDEISNLSKGDYVLCTILFKGLKIANDCINEEWEVKELITQEKFDLIHNNNENLETLQMEDVIECIETNLNNNENNINKKELNETELNETELNETELNETDLNKTELNETELNKTELTNIENYKLIEYKKDNNIEYIEKIGLDQTDIDIISDIEDITLNVKTETINKKKSSKETNSIHKIYNNKIKKNELNKKDFIKKHSKKLIFT
jgi:hypothetical protein